MKITTMILVSLLVLCAGNPPVNTAKVTSEKYVEAPKGIAGAIAPDSEFVRLVPSEERFVMEAGREIVVLAIGECKPSETTGRIEFLPPIQDFVELIPLCRASGYAFGALIIKPQNKTLAYIR